jgi:lipopolysaccharide/colanic/teichoic acid biosynthesis glycosyltransferase
MQVVRRKYKEHKNPPLVKGVDSLAVLKFIENNLEGTDHSRKAVLAVDNKFSIANLPELLTKNPNYSSIVNLKKTNEIARITELFCAVNNKLEIGGRFITCVETAALRKKRIYKKFPKGINSIYYFFDYFGKRVAPKLPITRHVYQFLTANRNRVLTSVEVLGRLCYCGFKIIETKEIDRLLYISVEKIENKVDLPDKNYGFLFKMERTGFKGKVIDVYKVRSMHAYAEYLQEYIYSQNKLNDIGKFKNDYRVNVIGKLSRKLWIDELPMIINLLKGDLKLVGVRPLSKHFLSLYNNDVREKRSEFKPGLVPPYYADMPKSLDEVMDSEMRYFKAYEKSPLKTDIIYFFKAANNILIKKARSK